MVVCHVNEERREKIQTLGTLWELVFAGIVVFTFYTKLYLCDPILS